MSLFKYLDRSKSQKDDLVLQEQSVLSLEEEIADLKEILPSGQDEADGLDDIVQSPCIARLLNGGSTARNMVTKELELQPQDVRIEIDMQATPSGLTQEEVMSGPNEPEATIQASYVRLSQSEQEAMDKAPDWAKLLYREVKSQSVQYSQLKVSFTAFKAVINQRLNEHDSSLQFVSSKYDDFEMQKDNLERQLDSLNHRNDDIYSYVKELEAKIEDLEQYSRRNCLILGGYEEKKQENTDSIVQDTVREKLKVELTLDDIERTHRLGGRRKQEEGLEPAASRPIIIKFCSYRKRQEVFARKKLLKGSGLVLMENLTQTRFNLFRKVKEVVGLKNCWTSDGRIYAVRQQDQKVVVITKIEDLGSLY